MAEAPSRRAVVFRELADAFQPSQFDARIDLNMRAHMSGALQDRFLERALATFVNVLGRELLLLPRRFPNGFLDIALFRRTPIQDAGLVEVNVGLDK
jgi:hypothetical protein